MRGVAGGPNPARRAPRICGAPKRGRLDARPSPIGCREGGGHHRGRQPYAARLSATDISALASMKNVAKCDTWCELQNPANHRVFERKLRPRPPGRGHACLGVTPSDAPMPRGPAIGFPGKPDALNGSPCPSRCGGPKTGPLAGAGHGGWWTLVRSCRRAVGPRRRRRALLPPHPPPKRAPLPGRGWCASDRDPRSGGNTRRA